MDGMTMLFKSMGLDPEDLKAKAAQAQAALVTMVQTIQRIEKRLDNIESQLNAVIGTKDTTHGDTGSNSSSQ